MIVILIFVVTPLLILGIRHLLKFDRNKNQKLNLIFLGFLLFMVGLYISTFILSNYNLYWSGYRSTSFIFIGLTLTLILFYWLYPIEKLNILLNLSLYLFIFISSGIAIFLSWEIKDEYDKQLFYLDSKYRLEETEIGLMRVPKLPKLFVKNGLIEKKYLLDTIYDNPNYSYPTQYYIPREKIILIKIKEIGNKTISVIIFHNSDTNRVRKNPLEFRIKL